MTNRIPVTIPTIATTERDGGDNEDGFFFFPLGFECGFFFFPDPGEQSQFTNIPPPDPQLIYEFPVSPCGHSNSHFLPRANELPQLPKLQGEIVVLERLQGGRSGGGGGHDGSTNGQPSLPGSHGITGGSWMSEILFT